MIWPFGDLEAGAYSVILADPPWTFKTYSDKGIGKSPQAQYACMDLAAIQALPVAELGKPDAVCVMWATAPMLPQAVETMARWGFRYKTAGAWAKQSKTGQKIAFGTGYIFRSAAEFYLVGTRGKPVTRARNVRNLILAPVREHSRKPDRMRSDVEALWDGPYCELFAREPSPGWDTFGNEVARFAGTADNKIEGVA